MAFEIKNGVLEKYTEEKGVTEVTIPDGVISISDNAFKYCTSITGITIPESVKNIGNLAFLGCESLTDINVSEKNKGFCSCGGVLYNKDMTMLIKYPTAKETSGFIISDSVISIGYMAFSYCESLTSITIPDNVKHIDFCAFSNCENLTSITILNGVTIIGDGAFCRCYNLISITIPDSVISIGTRAFADCSSLKSITIPDSVKSIGNHAFYRCTKLKSITIPDDVKINEYGVFYNCDALTSLKIYKNDVNVSLTFEHHLEIADSRTYLHMIIVSDIDNRQQYFNDLKPCYQIPLALFMTFAYPQESSYYISYLKNNVEDAGVIFQAKYKKR